MAARRIELARKAEERSAPAGQELVVAHLSRRTWRRITTRIGVIALAVLVGGLGGLALYVFLEAL